VLHIISHQRNANKNNKVTHYTPDNMAKAGTLTTSNASKDEEQPECPFTGNGDAQ
jgi:hypothetical protein